MGKASTGVGYVFNITAAAAARMAHGDCTQWTCAIRFAVRLVRGPAPKGAKMFKASGVTSKSEAHSSRPVPSRTARLLQRASRSAPISRTSSKTSNGARSSKDGEERRRFRNDMACAEHETLQPKPLNRRVPERENGTVDRNSASVGRWGVFMW